MGHPHAATQGADLLADLSDDLRRTYDALLFLGATGPGGGCEVRALSKQVLESRHELEYRLHELKERGLVDREKVGPETVWFVRR